MMLALLSWLVLGSQPAVADPGGAGADADTPEDDRSENRVGAKTPPPLAREPRPAELTFELPKAKNNEEYANLPYPHETYLGAEMLKLDPMFVYAVQQGLELMYLRKYNQAREHFAQVEQTFPGTATRSVADTLVWQALMLENFDYRYDKQYWVSSKEARKALDAALQTPGNDAWEHMASAAIVGIESIHTMRQGSYLSALQLAFQAMDHIERCRAAAPGYVDLKLADGLYNYWRSVITMNSKVLPDFGDHRVEGIEQMSQVEDAGIFLKPLASLSLAFTWLEENDLKRANTACNRNRTKYPDNIINNLTCGSIYTEERRYPDALAVYERVLQVDPKNMRVHYLKGYTLLKAGDLDRAKTELTTYLAAEYLEPYQRSYGHLRLAQVYSRQQAFAQAVENYKASIKVDGNKIAKTQLDKLEQRRKDGKISW